MDDSTTEDDQAGTLQLLHLESRWSIRSVASVLHDLQPNSIDKPNAGQYMCF